MDIEDKVKEILQFVFELSEEHDVTSYSVDTVDEWDSIKQVAIITALENEFEQFIEIETAEQLTSYTKIINYLGN